MAADLTVRPVPPRPALLQDLDPGWERSVDAEVHSVPVDLSPAARDVVERRGRHVSDRMAAERQLRRDTKEARDAISAEWVRRGYGAGPPHEEMHQRRYPWLHEEPAAALEVANADAPSSPGVEPGLRPPA